jgi:ABC-2 type transport system permease protein
MHNVWLIARREYVERVRTRGFLITTVMIPLIMGGLLYGSAYVSSKSVPEAHIAIVSSDTQLALDLQSELQQQQGTSPAQPRSSRQPLLTVDAMDAAPQNAQATRALLNRELDSGDLDAYLWIAPAATPANAPAQSQPARPTFTFTPRSSEQNYLRSILAAALGTVLMREQLAHRGIVASDADTLLQPIDILAVHIPHRDDRESAEVSITVLFILMYMVISLYGMNVARSIIEEKTSRIFEVMLATIRPEEMMAGKILGVGSVGLTQVGIWLTAALLLSASSIASSLGSQGIHVALTVAQIVYFFVYFTLGYAFYSSIAAGLGAMTNSEHELQQINLFLILPLIVCFVTLKSVLTYPDSTMACVLALVPPFTPLLMYLRVSLGHPSPAAIVASLLLTSASIYAIVWVSSRIYRVGVLMYGKRPTLPELLRWLKYS